MSPKRPKSLQDSLGASTNPYSADWAWDDVPAKVTQLGLESGLLVRCVHGYRSTPDLRERPPAPGPPGSLFHRWSLVKHVGGCRHCTGRGVS